MARRYPPLPRRWLMTDERMGDGLIPAIRALPKGSGIIFRHYGLPRHERRALLIAIRRIARARRLTLVVAGETFGLRCDGNHRNSGQVHSQIGSRGLLTIPVHSHPERRSAERAGADMVLVSPVFKTRSHPGAAELGRVRFGLLVRGCRIPVIALGGMHEARAKSLSGFEIYGWAGIDAFSRQKRKAVPR